MCVCSSAVPGEGRTGQVVPAVLKPGDVPGLLSERAVIQAQEGTLRIATVILGPSKLLLPLGPSQRKLRYFLGATCKGPRGGSL